MRAVVASAGAVVLGAIGAGCLVVGVWSGIALIQGIEAEVGDRFFVLLTIASLVLGFACLAGAVAAFRARA
jgi:hypothetical protein